MGHFFTEKDALRCGVLASRTWLVADYMSMILIISSTNDNANKTKVGRIGDISCFDYCYNDIFCFVFASSKS